MKTRYRLEKSIDIDEDGDFESSVSVTKNVHEGFQDVYDIRYSANMQVQNISLYQDEAEALLKILKSWLEEE